MSDPPASPRATRLATPSWLDGRLVFGVLLVLVSVVVGARLLASADASQNVWVATRDLAPGSTLADGDLKPARVRLFDNGARYLVASGAKPVGYVLQRGVGGDELLPRDNLVRPDERGRSLRDISVPVAAGHLPDDLQAGQQVDVYVTPGPSRTGDAPPTAGSASAPTGTRLVLSRVPVMLRPRTGGLGANGTAGVVLSVAESDATALVAAVQEGGVDLVRVPRGEELPSLSALVPAPAGPPAGTSPAATPPAAAAPGTG